MTWTVPPTIVPTSRIVVAPRPISPEVFGECPSTVDSKRGPRIGAPASAPTTTLSIEIAGSAIPSVMSVIAEFCSKELINIGSGNPPLLGSEMLSWKGSPYRVGVVVRWSRLAPNTAVPQRAITASTVARRVLPTGTLARPTRRSRRVADADHDARRCADRPETAGCLGGRHSDYSVACPGSTSCPDCWPEAEDKHHGNGGKRTDRQHERVEFDPSRTLGQTGLAERSNRGEKGGNHHRPESADEPDHKIACTPEQDQLTPLDPEGNKRREVFALGCALAGKRLTNDRQSDQRGQ